MKHTAPLLITLFCLVTYPVLSQEKIGISAGFGFPELLNAGIRLHGKQSQFGLTYGSLPIKDESTHSFAADVYFHFGGTAKLSPRKPWFVRFSLNHFRNESIYLIEQYTYFTPAMGREMNISKRVGFQIHAGTAIQLYEHIVDKQPSGWDLHISIPILPSFGVATFYKI